jgi:hypothetical protein
MNSFWATVSNLLLQRELRQEDLHPRWVMNFQTGPI